ncbi:MAG: hypothetical protein ACOCVP_02850 [Wenzhouxiangella sp.]
MTEISSGLNHILRELNRRHVFRVMGGYVVSFWVVLQVGDVILAPLGAPDWVMLVLIAIGIIGAPVVFVLAWVYDLTTEGVRRTDDLAEVDADVVPDWMPAKPPGGWAWSRCWKAACAVPDHGCESAPA